MSKWIRPERWKVAIGITLMLWAVLFIILRIDSGSNNPSTASAINQKPANLGIQIKSEILKTNIPNEDDISKNNNKNPRTATEIAVVDSWFKKVGYDANNLSVYQSYSGKQLLDLAEKGDVNALQVIIEKHINEGNGAAAKPFVDKAIIYGSLNAISKAAIISSPPIYEGTQVPYDESKAQLKESFAYNELLRFRGDDHAADVYKKSHLELFENIYGRTHSMSIDDEQWIQSRAKELYDQYQAERYKLGLGDFDNETPREVIDFMNK